ncbi:hypothetical protein ACFXPY_27375 [Streptomyces sp. NPDC059153]|uniref:hypothetical protein n=1 Tax=Streptomyces sp. NPDC059153 TaxID=3346743 RepID=UPI0036936F77
MNSADREVRVFGVTSGSSIRRAQAAASGEGSVESDLLSSVSMEPGRREFTRCSAS